MINCSVRKRQYERNDIDNRKKVFADKFNAMYCGKFQYVGGYTTSDGMVAVRCLSCNAEISVGAQTTRGSGNNIRCGACVKARAEARMDAQSITRESKRCVKAVADVRDDAWLTVIDAKLKAPIACATCGDMFVRDGLSQINCNSCIENIKEIRKSQKIIVQQMCQCKECDKLFLRTRQLQTCCSFDCRRRYCRRAAAIRRRHKVSENGRIDWDISIARLMKRNGVACGLCGNDVDLNDYHTTDSGTIVTGNNYPSIDHVFPISRGGTHTWDNVQLACRQCNSVKRDLVAMIC